MSVACMHLFACHFHVLDPAPAIFFASHYLRPTTSELSIHRPLPSLTTSNMSNSRIEYSEKYADEENEYRYVVTPKRGGVEIAATVSIDGDQFLDAGDNTFVYYFWNDYRHPPTHSYLPRASS